MYLTTFKIMQASAFLPVPILIGFDHADSPDYYRTMGPFRTETYVTFQYTLAGEGRLRFDGRELPLPAGTGFISSSQDARITYYYPPDGVCPWEFLYLEFSGAGMLDAAKEMVERNGPRYTLNLKKNFLAELLSFRHPPNTRVFSGTEGAQLVYGLLSALTSCGQETAAIHPVAQACAMVTGNIGRNFTVAELAGHVNMSREHFTRQFKTALGISPWQYVLREKIKYGCMMLQRGATTNKEIAVELGFESAAQFERVFRRITGVTPKTFRGHENQLQIIRNFNFPCASPPDAAPFFG